eukprot:scaffold184890_cov39-Prasinocladus_malaysianus.AAC.2
MQPSIATTDNGEATTAANSEDSAVHKIRCNAQNDITVMHEAATHCMYLSRDGVGATCHTATKSQTRPQRFNGGDTVAQLSDGCFNIVSATRHTDCEVVIAYSMQDKSCCLPGKYFHVHLPQDIMSLPGDIFPSRHQQLFICGSNMHCWVVVVSFWYTAFQSYRLKDRLPA